jgi:Zn-dependent alcohol dehydrogenase
MHGPWVEVTPWTSSAGRVQHTSSRPTKNSYEIDLIQQIRVALVSVIDGRYRLSEIQQAFRRFAEGTYVGKIVISAT